jgi:hypothetical protein
MLNGAPAKPEAGLFLPERDRFRWKQLQFGGRSRFFAGPRDFAGKPEDHFS